MSKRKSEALAATGTSSAPTPPIKKESKLEESADTSAAGKPADSSLKTIVIKGKAAVDSECLSATSNCNLAVHHDSKGAPLDVMLNQSNLSANNNKFYILQLLRDATQNASYFVWFRWGRVGAVGQHKLEPHGSNFDAAMRSFTKKFSDKSGNAWEQRGNFEKRAGKYDLVHIDYATDGGDANRTSLKTEKKEKQEEVEKVESKLSEQLQELMRMISSKETMERSVKQMKYDSKRAPLGHLTANQIKDGYAALQRIEALIKAKQQQEEEQEEEGGDDENDDATGNGKMKSGRPKRRKAVTKSSGTLASSTVSGSEITSFSRAKLVDACSQFYTKIPHDFGMKIPPLIETSREIREKMELLEALSDIEIAISLLNNAANSPQKTTPKHPLDEAFSSLNTQMRVVASDSPRFALIRDYLMRTHASTHRLYSKMHLLELFELEKNFGIDNTAAQQQQQEMFDRLGNRMLLWHGSRMSNWMGILSQGLRIAPPEAPSTGYMFGKGVYFADVSSKSANYAYPSRAQHTCLLLLCEVALGDQLRLVHADYDAHKKCSSAPRASAAVASSSSSSSSTGASTSKMNSVFGLGQMQPDPAQWTSIDDGCVVPVGKIVKSGPDSTILNYALNYNEFVVYDTRQIRMKYLLKVKFDF